MILLNQEQAAARLCLSPRTLERLRVTGFGPQYYKLGRKVAYGESDLDAWVNARRRNSTSEAQR
jgi:predicted DNA-binding transcriptional regulator AlpA